MAMVLFRAAAPQTVGMFKQFFSVAPRGAKNLVKGGIAAVGIVILAFFTMRWLGVSTEVNGELFGVPYEVSLLVLILGILFWMDGNVYIQTHHIGLTRYHYGFASSVVMIAVVLSIVIHELSHGLVSAWCGFPIDHAGISWWGAFVAPDVESLDVMTPWQQIVMTAAGPFSNFLLAGLAALIVWWKNENLFENTVQYFAVVNIRLGKFNLIPILFFDGGKMADGLLRLINENARFRSIMMIVIVALFFFGLRLWKSIRTESWEDKLANL